MKRTLICPPVEVGGVLAWTQFFNFSSFLFFSRHSAIMFSYLPMKAVKVTDRLKGDERAAAAAAAA